MSATLAPTRPSAARLPAALALAGGLIALGLIFLPECRAAVGVWIDSTAYGHCFLVAPISAYLAWERRDRLRGMVPRPMPAAAVLGLPLMLAWFAAERLGIMEGRQLAVLGFVEVLFLAVLGWPLFRVLLAPLLYLVFLVPFGAFITPALQTFTAHFIDVGLTVLGISHFANEMIIEISAGTFFVAEACAGLRFLIAAVAFGVFYALLNYRSPGRRIAFVAISIVVPILANGVRALGIVLLGHVLGSAEAAAADHLVYGWVFFSVVMLCLVLIGLPLREPVAEPASPASRPAPRPADGGWSQGALIGAAVTVLVLAAIAPAGAAALQRYAASPVLRGTATIRAPEGCTATRQEAGPDRIHAAIRCGDRDWSFTIQAVAARSTGSALAEVRGRLAGALGAENATTTALRGTAPDASRWQLVVSREPELVAATAAWLHGRPASGGMRQRLMQAKDSILGNDTPPVLIALSTRPRRSLSESELEGLVAELNQILAAQPDLDAEVLALVGS